MRQLALPAAAAAVLFPSALAFVVGLLLPAAAAAETLVSCPFNSGGGDVHARGFYVTDFSARTLDTVTLQFSSTLVAESKTILLTARHGDYAGLIIGSATVTSWLPTGAATTPLSFDFSKARVAINPTITFELSVLSGGPVSYNTGVGPCENITQTNGTTPPLDTFRRDSVGIVIASSPPTEIPALAPAGLVALAAALAASAGVGLRGRRGRKRYD